LITINKKHRQRLALIVLLIFGVGIAVMLVLRALSSNINLFYTPLELSQVQLPEKTLVRVGGMVVKHSVIRGEHLKIAFKITDFEKELWIDYQGILPDLFREGQGVVIQGYLSADNRFHAKQILAKHDEKYMPPELKNIPQVAP
jgi:cytochrome c-type biogenesis protein CcmE